MLVLSRKKNEVFKIGRGDRAITIMFLGFSDGKARIGIEAPRDLDIYRPGEGNGQGTSDKQPRDQL